MSKFDKTCPECSSTNSAGAVQCACGYLFSPLYLQDPRLALELAVREEKLIEEYLTARAEQTAEAANTAAHRADEDPDDARKSVEAAIAKLDAETAHAELAEQHLRACEAESRLAAHSVATNQSHKPADIDGSKAVVAGTASWQAAILAEALKAAKVQTFDPTPVRRTPAVASKRPTSAFRTAQATKADQAVKAANSLETMRCPSCGSAITLADAVCRCGWSVPTSVPEHNRPSQTPSTDQGAARTPDLATKKKPTESR